MSPSHTPIRIHFTRLVTPCGSECTRPPRPLGMRTMRNCTARVSPKSFPSRRASGPPSVTWFLESRRFCPPNVVLVSSAVFTQLNKHADTQTTLRTTRVGVDGRFWTISISGNRNVQNRPSNPTDEYRQGPHLHTPRAGDTAHAVMLDGR